MWQGAREVSWTPTEFSLGLLEFLPPPTPFFPRSRKKKRKPCQISEPASAPSILQGQRLSLGPGATHRARICCSQSVADLLNCL